MKAFLPRFLPGTGLTLVLLAITIWWIAKPRDTPENQDEQPRSAPRGAGVPSPDGRSARLDQRPGARQSRKGRVSRNQLVQLAPNLVLATVNGTPIRAAHLSPVEPFRNDPVVMERRVYLTRLQRAIDAELVSQEAAAAGIGFTEAQQGQLHQIAARHEARLEEWKSEGITWDTVTREQIDLELHLTEAKFLRQNLVAAETGTAPSPIRAKQEGYEEALQSLLDRLKSKATIERSAVASN